MSKEEQANITKEINKERDRKLKETADTLNYLFDKFEKDKKSDSIREFKKWVENLQVFDLLFKT